MIMSNDKMKAFSDKIEASIDKHVEENESFAWVKPWSEMDTVFRNAFSNRPYSGLHNILTCVISDFDDPRYITFNQIRKAKGKLKAGSKATAIIFWKMLTQEVEKNGVKEMRTIPFMRTIPVFNVEQTEGLDLPSIEIELNEDMEQSQIVEDLFNSLNVKSNINSDKLSNTACYIPSLDEINLPNYKQFKDKRAYVGTAIHELVHWTASRVNRNCETYGFDIEERALEELVAEIGTMYLCMRMGVDGVMNKENLAYVNMWKKGIKGKNGKGMIYKACKLAEVAAKYIINESGLDIFSEIEVEEKETV